MSPTQKRATGKRKDTTLAQLQEKVARSKFAGYLDSPTLESADSFFKTCFAQRKNIRKQEEGKPVMERDEFITACNSPEAEAFASTMIAKLEHAAESLGYDVCQLQPIVIHSLPAGGHTPATVSIAVGFVREDGKITPVAISHEFVLTQGGDGTFHAGRYDEGTNFETLFGSNLKPTSFI